MKQACQRQGSMKTCNFLSTTVELHQGVKIFGGRAEPRGGRQWQAGRKLEEAQGGATCATATTWDQVQEPPWLLCEYVFRPFLPHNY